jgi:CBS domain containing-hemolysin-like protein
LLLKAVFGILTHDTENHLSMTRPEMKRETAPVNSKPADAGAVGSGVTKPENPASSGASEEPHPDTASEADPASQSGNGESGWFSRVFSLRRGNQASIRDDLHEALSRSGTAEGEFTQEEKLMLHNILRLQDVRVEDLMIPRAEIEAVELNTTLGEILTLFESSGHSRMPVYVETLDDPRGMIHIRDVVGFITRTANTRKRNRNGVRELDLTKVDLTRELGKLNLVRKVIFAPPSMMAADLMTRMQATRIQMALVIDEYGGTEGLISLEDIVELIVGDIEDEHDDDEELIRQNDKGELICDARAEIDEIRKILGAKFDFEDHDEDAETIGGVIFSLLGRVPVKGEVIEAFGFEFRITDADPRRIKSILMVPAKKHASRKSLPGE